MCKEYGLTNQSFVLQIGCEKGFLLHDFQQAQPGIKIRGTDISEYAIENTIESMKHHVQVADAKALPFEDNYFDVVISINTVHNLEREECGKALQEIERVSNERSFITVDAYHNNEEKEAMLSWNLTGKTIMHVEEWKIFFDEIDYTGDYYWFIP